MANLSDFSVEEIVSWRNTASTRVNEADKAIDKLMNEIDKITKFAKKDRVWIAKLNRHLNNKVFGYKTQIYNGEVK
jgi:thiamine biosynthesis lipoprotein ApbE